MPIPFGFTVAYHQYPAIACTRSRTLRQLVDRTITGDSIMGTGTGLCRCRRSVLLLPGEHGLSGAVLGTGDYADPYAYAHGPFALPAGTHWQPTGTWDPIKQATLTLGWGLGSYRFTRYRLPDRAPAELAVTPTPETLALIQACLRVRDWVNTPTQDMGPEELQTITRDLAQRHGGTFESIIGEALLTQNFPTIHAVGRASTVRHVFYNSTGVNTPILT